MGVFIIAIFGLCLGSFINVVAHRTANNKPWIASRSRCDRCNHILAWYDLLPLISFVWLRGRCRYCHKKISWGHVVSEIVSAVLVLGAWYLALNQATSYQLPATSLFIIYTGIVVSLWGLLIADYYYYLLPDQLMLSFFIFTSFRYLMLLISSPTSNLPFLSANLPLLTSNFLFAIGTGLLNAVLFILLIIISKGRGMGFGDVKLVFIIGLLLGFPLGLIAVYLAFLTGGLIAAILVIGRRKKFGQIIPFGPFLIISTYFCIFFGNYLLIWISQFI